MAKLKGKGPEPAKAPAQAAQAPAQGAAGDAGNGSQEQQTTPTAQTTGGQPAGPVPFGVQAPGAPAAAAAAGPRPNLVQKRQEKIQEAIKGRTFKFKEERRGQPFNCFCGAAGKNAIVLEATNTETGEVVEVLCGGDCLKYTGVTLEKTPRQPRTATAPGINKQQKFAERLAAYTAPFRFVREQVGPFTCFCGGRGTNQVVIADVNGAEFSVGKTCAAVIPGVEVPKPVKATPSGAPPVSGLKGSVPAPPQFQNVG